MNFPNPTPPYLHIGKTNANAQNEIINIGESNTTNKITNTNKTKPFENRNVINTNIASMHSSTFNDIIIINNCDLNNFHFPTKNIINNKEPNNKNRDMNNNYSHKYYNFNHLNTDIYTNGDFRNGNIGISNSSSNFYGASGFNYARKKDNPIAFNANRLSISSLIRSDIKHNDITSNLINKNDENNNNDKNNPSLSEIRIQNNEYSIKNINNIFNENTNSLSGITERINFSENESDNNDHPILINLETNNTNDEKENESENDNIKNTKIPQNVEDIISEHESEIIIINKTHQETSGMKATEPEKNSKNIDKTDHSSKESENGSDEDEASEQSSTSDFFIEDRVFKSKCAIQPMQHQLSPLLSIDSTSPNDNNTVFFNHASSDNLADDESENQESESESDEERYGYLLYLYYGKHNPNENLVFRRICMRYGLQAWDEMNVYLPWRSRADLRLTLMKMIRKQAIGEYNNIRADPALIGTDNHEFLHDNCIFKGGMWVNQKWDKDEIEKENVRSTNKEKYNLKTSEALEVDVPIVMNVNYIIKKMRKRKQSLVLYNSALSAEMEKRTGRERSTKGMNELRYINCHDAKIKSSKLLLNYSHNISRMVYDVPDFND